MKRTLPFLLLALLFCATLSAQTFGFRLGYTNTNISTEFDGLELETNGQGNLMLGAFVNLPIGTNVISIQPEINYLNRGFSNDDQTIEVNGFGIDFDATDVTVSFLELGTLLRLNFNLDGPVGLYVGAGPSFNYALSGKVETLGQEIDFTFDDDDGAKRSGLYGTAAAGVNFGGSDGLGFFGEVRYQTSFGDFFEDDESKFRTFGINAGIRVPLGG